jgi:hypothetical protein
MPPLPPVPGVVKIEFLWTQNGVPAANIFHASYSGSAPSSSDCTAIAGQIDTAFWTSGFRGFFSNFTTLQGIRVTDIATDTGASGEYSDGNSGTISEEGVGAQMCVLVNYSIARRYRGGHPRTYYPGLSNTYLESPQQWDSDGVTAVNSAAANLYEILQTASSGSTTLTGQVCVSYRTGDAPRVTPLVEAISSAVVNGSVKTQRRRLTASSY